MYKNLKLSMKLTLGFGLVLILSTIVTVVGVFYLNQVADTTRQMYDHPYTVATEILQAQRNIIAIDRDVADMLLATDATVQRDKIKDIEELEQAVYDVFDTLYVAFTGEKQLLDDALQSIRDWKPVRDEVIRLSNMGLDAQAESFEKEHNAPQVTLIEANIQRIVGYSEENARQFNDLARRAADDARNIVILLLVVVYLVAILAATVITRGISRPVSKLLTFAGAISHGNLAMDEVDYESRDEIGILTKALHGMKDNLSEIVGSVRDSVNVVNASSDQTSAGAQQTSASVEQLASMANEFASAVDRLSANAQDMASSAKETNDLSIQGSMDIEKTVETMTEINKVVNALAVDIRELGRQSEEIGQIVTLITGIADQTNLLALNAAIEAARAGEQGRGFAVVADEVRKLAEESAQATGKITELINGIRNSARDSVRNTDLGTNKVNEGMEIVAHTGQMFDQIAAIIKNLAGEIGDVAAAAEELAAGAEEIGATTQEQSASTEQIATAAIEVAQAVARVHQDMSWFKLN